MLDFSRLWQAQRRKGLQKSTGMCFDSLPLLPPLRSCRHSGAAAIEDCRPLPSPALRGGTPWRMSLFVLLGLLLMLAWPRSAHAAESYANCTNVITTLPVTITAQGILSPRVGPTATASTTIKAITIKAENVTLDCKRFRAQRDSAAWPPIAYGVYAGEPHQHHRPPLQHPGLQDRDFDSRRQQLRPPDRGQPTFRSNTSHKGVNLQGDGSVVRRNVSVQHRRRHDRDHPGLMASTRRARSQSRTIR